MIIMRHILKHIGPYILNRITFALKQIIYMSYKNRLDQVSLKYPLKSSNGTDPLTVYQARSVVLIIIASRAQTISWHVTYRLYHPWVMPGRCPLNCLLKMLCRHIGPTKLDVSYISITRVLLTVTCSRSIWGHSMHLQCLTVLRSYPSHIAS